MKYTAGYVLYKHMYAFKIGAKLVTYYQILSNIFNGIC